MPACQSLDCVSVFALSCADADAILKVVPSRRRPGDRQGLPLRRAGRQGRRVLRRRGLCGALRTGDRAPEGLGRHAGRDRLRAFPTPPNCSTAGRGWPSVRRRSALHRERRGEAEFGRPPRDHPARPQVQRRRCLRGPVQARASGRAPRPRARTLPSCMLPTAGTIYRVADIEREPMRYNINLGHYTNFVNFFGLSALSLCRGLPARRPALRHHPDRPNRMPSAPCWPSARAGSAP